MPALTYLGDSLYGRQGRIQDFLKEGVVRLYNNLRWRRHGMSAIGAGFSGVRACLTGNFLILPSKTPHSWDSKSNFIVLIITVQRGGGGGGGGVRPPPPPPRPPPRTTQDTMQAQGMHNVHNISHVYCFTMTVTNSGTGTWGWGHWEVFFGTWDDR